MTKQPPKPLTDYQIKLDALARDMADKNSNAAKDLAERLLWYVQESERLAPASIGLNLNFVTGELESRTGQG